MMTTRREQSAAAPASGEHETVPQWLLPGQAAAPEGPVDVHLMYVMHHAFRRDLAMFVDAASATPAADRDTWEALAQRWHTFSEILHHHHHGEDSVLWPRLQESATEEERSVLTAMTHEHAGIDPALSACSRGFESMLSAPDRSTALALAEALDEARVSLSAHLAHEESHAMALVQKYLTTSEWTAIEDAAFRSGQSLRDVVAMVPWVLHGLPGDRRDALLAEAPTLMRLIWVATRARFDRLDARATRHLPSA